MGLRFMEHILILSHDPQGTADWWVGNLGFTEGAHPEFGFPVHWLYIGEQDVIHIGQRDFSKHQNTYLQTPEQQASGAQYDTGSGGSGRIDHVCFNCEGLQEFIDRFESNGIEFSERQAHDQSLYQLFLRDPINGIKVELNFTAEEAQSAGRQAAMTGAGAND